MKSVNEISKKTLFTTTTDALVQPTVETMASANIGAIIVIHKDKVEGIFSERDLLTRVIAEKKDPLTTVISTVMTAPVKTILATTSIEEASEIMHQGNFRHLPVVNKEGFLVGMVSIKDILSLDRSVSPQKKAS